MALEPIQASGFFIFKREPDGRLRFLLIRSQRDGMWGFPKGHVDAGEQVGSAAIRELKEETGIGNFRRVGDFSATITYKVRRNTGTRDKSVTYYLAEVEPKTAVLLSEEHHDYKWCVAQSALESIKFDNLRDALKSAVEFLEKNPSP
jgi:8-oxo-dGTP pyrophosphatase MutT (NUDIX family)